MAKHMSRPLSTLEAYIATLEIKIGAKRIVFRRNFSASKIAVLILMYVRRENVTNANMMRTMLEM